MPLFLQIAKGGNAMTRNQLIQIYRLKRKNYPTKEIAGITGISLGTIKMQFSRHSEFKEEGVCLCCGKSFGITIINPFKKYCSKQCRINYWSKKRKIDHRKSTVKQVCPLCGKEFLNYGRKRAIYCSRECYQESRRHKDEN